MAESISNGDVVWQPPAELVRDCELTRYLGWLERERGLHFDDYFALWRWSADDLDAFWQSIWDFMPVQASRGSDTVLADASMPGAVWFPGAELNYAEHLLRHARDDAPALVFVPEEGETQETSWAELRRQAGALAASLRQLGIERGDRVVAYLPNLPEAIVGLIACASIGAIWSICAPEYGTAGVASRFRQLNPKLLFAVPGYRFNGKDYDRRGEVERLARELEVEHVVWVGEPSPLAVESHAWADLVRDDADLVFEQLPFDHPLWVLFSSGTTGIPKGIVHGHGGILLSHLVEHRLHFDLRPGDRFQLVANTSWMVWNILVSGLLAGATLIVQDGSPVYPDAGRVWRVAAEQRATLLGLGAGLIQASMKAGLRPAGEHDLSGLKELISTGSPLPSSAFAWVYDAISPDVWLATTSGGTDICSGFVVGCPLLPVRAGRMQAPKLGVAVEAWDEQGRPLVGSTGELVVTKPIPSMPLRFWGDEDGSRYHDSYFSMFPGVWRHGDYIEFDADGSSVIQGRSDSTLNRRGVRIGTAEIYSVVERLPEVREALVIGAELGDDYYMPMFVVPTAGAGSGDDELRKTIVAAIRDALSPRHVPDEIIVVPGIPHTKTGKKLEVPVKRLLQGATAVEAADPASVDDPELLDFYVDFANRKHGGST